MNADEAKGTEKFFARQIKAMPGGMESACSWPDSPVTGKQLSEVLTGCRRLRLGEAVFIAAVNGRADLFRMIADMIDGGAGQGGDTSLAPLAVTDALDSADLARTVRDAEADGVRSSAEMAAITAAAMKNLQNAIEIVTRLQDVKPGPIARPASVAAE